jgi:hypothetical protein
MIVQFPPTFKFCHGCNVDRHASEFQKNNTRPDGLQTRCRACMNVARKDWELRHPIETAIRNRRGVENAAYIAKHRAWRDRNRDVINARSKQWADANRDKTRASVTAWDRRNKPRKKQIKREREGLQRLATPAWSDFAAMQQYYLIAEYLTQELGIAFHVDHVMPIKSDIVCGLHSHTNLAIAVGAWNIAKHNRYWPDMPTSDAISIRD